MAETELGLLAAGIEKFAKQLHRKLKRLNSTKIFSPVSIHAFLVLLSQDTSFNSKNFLNAILHIDVKKAIDRYKDIFGAFGTLDDLFIMNTCFFQHLTMLQDAFKHCLKNNFFSNMKFMNFTAQEGANEILNDYVKNKTAYKITHFSGLKDGTNLAFLNTIYFQNDFVAPFAIENTVSELFHLNATTKITVQMMRKKGEFYYKFDPMFKVKILKLPFANSNISLVVILPETTVNEIYSYDLKLLTNNMTKQEVDVSLPKFKLDEVLQLSDSLKGMGLQDVFSTNFFGIIDSEVLGFSEMEQKVHLEVNENGSEMATGTLSTLINALDEKVSPKDGLIIYEANISTEISNRFAKTTVIWRVSNSNTTAANAEFKVVLTETAFITGFEMEIEGKTYKSYIKEKEQAKDIYNKAVAQGQSAGLVETKTRDSTEFVVSVNLESGFVAVFSLTYEEMLQRVHDQYELVLNICPGQIVDDLNVEVRINESRPLKFVKTPPFRSGNDIRTNTKSDNYLEPDSNIKIINSKTASVKFHPDPITQKKMTLGLGKRVSEGLLGQFVVQYDVEREPCNGEVLLQDGYFVHFFAPNDLDPLPKHVIFVLDTSSSMSGKKIGQLKDAMTNILSDLQKEDMLHIMEFNSNVIVWDVNSKKFTVLIESMIKDYREPFPFIQRHILPDPQCVDETVINKAQEVVQEMTANGSTFAIGGLETALYLAREGLKLNENKDEKVHPLVVFLTDGEPNVGVGSKDLIVDMVTQLNIDTKVPIFSLSFGNEADKRFLRQLSLKNFGFSRHIYEAADASLQLQDFYKKISSPLLHNINFKYDADVTEVTRTWFPIYFRGSELVVSGRYGVAEASPKVLPVVEVNTEESSAEGSTFPTVIDCWGPHGLISVNSSSERPVTSLERLWAYLTVKQLLDARETAENSADLTREAVNLALKYSFVTDVTSLVVVKPNDTTPDCNVSVTPEFFGAPAPLPPVFGNPKGSARTQMINSLIAAHSRKSQEFQSKFGGSQAFQPNFGSSQGIGQVFGAASISNDYPEMHVYRQKLQKIQSPQTSGTVFGSFPQGGGPQKTGTVFGSFSQGGGTQTTGTGFAFPQGGGAETTGTGFASFPQSGASAGGFGTSSTNTGVFGISSTTAELSGTSSTPRFTFGCPADTSTTSDAQDKKSKTEKIFLANRPFMIMLQLEKDDTTLILLQGYIYRPSY